MSQPQLTARDEQLVETLLLRVKAMSVAQWQRASWPQGPDGWRACRIRLERLAEQGLVELAAGYGVHPSPATEPLLRWTPGCPAPDLGAVLANSHARWRAGSGGEGGSTLSLVEYITAGRNAAARFGYRPAVVRPSELSHDLILTNAFLATVGKRPEVARYWKSEWSVPDRREIGGCDAAIVTPGKRVAVEVVGSSYRSDDLDRLFDWVCAKQWGLELW
jgi:hypothetical protein